MTTHTRKLQPLVLQLFDEIIPQGFIQLVTKATRFIQGQEPSGLDHFYCNKPEKYSDIEIHTQGGSDHRLVSCTRFSKSFFNTNKIIRKRSFKNFEERKFIEALSNISFWEIYTCNDVNEAVDILTNKLTKILDEMAPVRTYQVRCKYAPWLSESTKTLMKQRDIA